MLRKNLLLYILFLICLKSLVSSNSSSTKIRKGNKEDLIPIPEHLLNYDTSGDEDKDYEELHKNPLESEKEVNYTRQEEEKTPNSYKKNDTSLSSYTHSENLAINNDSSYPIFLKEPSDTLVLRETPATIHCRVAYALGLHFQCNSEIVPTTRLEHHVEPESGIRYTEAFAQISREKIQEFFGDFHCACVAFSGKGSVVSRHALLSFAYLKKSFEVSPYSQQVTEGHTVEMRCHPPRGKPHPEISWNKNGSPFPGDSDREVSFLEPGVLLIRYVSKQDSGNYSCVASNIANTRISEPAYLSVLGNEGEWSNWNHWSSCNGLCGKGTSKRSRYCSENGKPCTGPSVQKKACYFDCPQSIHGNWSLWSSWSVCSPECFQHRRRTCSEPKPSRRGDYCFGPDLETNNCTEGFCQRSRQLLSIETKGPSLSKDEDVEGNENTSSLQLLLYIGTSFALAFSFIVIIVIVKFLKRKTLYPNGGYTLTSTDYGYNSSDDGKKSGLVYSPDILHPRLERGVSLETPTTLCYEYSYPDSNSSKNGFPRPLSEHHYEQPMVVFPSPSSNVDSKSSTVDRVFPITSTPLPIPPLRDFHIWSSVDSKGSIITIPETDVRLTVSPSNSSKSFDVFLSLQHEFESSLSLSKNETLLSPLVICGPSSSVSLKKPVIISFPHVASLRHGNWSLSLLMRSEKESGKKWKKLVTLGQETLNTPVYIQLDAFMCHIITESLTGFALIGESSRGLAYKSLRLASFASGGTPTQTLTIRVYVIFDTQDSLLYVTESEKRYNGRFLQSAPLLFQDGGMNLCVQMTSIGSPWSIQKEGGDVLEVPFSHIWNSLNPSLHCSFNLRRNSESLLKFSELSFTLSVHQKNKESETLTFSVSCHSLDSRDSSEPSYLETPFQKQSLGTSSSSSCIFKLSWNTLRTLSILLDLPCSDGRDWRLLAERLGVHRYATYFATRPSPTECILQLWEVRNKEPSSLLYLYNTLRDMGRLDAAIIVHQSR